MLAYPQPSLSLCLLHSRALLTHSLSPLLEVDPSPYSSYTVEAHFTHSLSSHLCPVSSPSLSLFSGGLLPRSRLDSLPRLPTLFEWTSLDPLIRWPLNTMVTSHTQQLIQQQTSSKVCKTVLNVRNEQSIQPLLHILVFLYLLVSGRNHFALSFFLSLNWVSSARSSSSNNNSSSSSSSR